MAKDSFQYAQAIYSFVSNLDDTHAFLINNEKNYDFMGNLLLPFVPKLINDSLIVVDDYASNINYRLLNGIQIGDIILKIDGVAIKQRIHDLLPYLSVSNESSQRKIVAFDLCKSKDSIAVLEILRDNKPLTINVKMYGKTTLISKDYKEKKPAKDWE